MSDSYDFKKEEDVKQFLENLGIEYRFGCFSEKNPSTCHLLGDYFEAINKDYEKASKVYRTNCDDSSFSKSCFKYGNYKFIGKGVKKDLNEAFKYYEKGCSAGDRDACLNAGLMNVTNSEITKDFTKDYDKGMKLLNKSCDKNLPFACHYIAGIFIKGVKDIIKQDMEKAFQYSMRACNLELPQACINLAQMYKRGDGVEKNMEKFEEFKQLAARLYEEQNVPVELKFAQGVQ